MNTWCDRWEYFWNGKRCLHIGLCASRPSWSSPRKGRPALLSFLKADLWNPSKHHHQLVVKFSRRRLVSKIMWLLLFYQVLTCKRLMWRRKNQSRKVVCIPAPTAAGGRPTGEVVPSDLWAWRKYGQKPIKGSPYPRYVYVWHIH